jgi:hypothetical protein
MNLAGAMIGGLIGGLIGGGVWMGVSYGTGYEIGWIAIGVGAATGVGVAKGGKTNGAPLGGVIAALLAVASILAAKYIVVQMLIHDAFEGKFSITVEDIPLASDREYWVSYIADELIREKEEAGFHVQWPAGVDPDEASEEKDFPPAIWRDAAARWDYMSPDIQGRYREVAAASIVTNVNQALAEIRADLSHGGYLATFSWYDILFGLLAIVTAYQIGCGGAAVKQEQPA